MNGKKNIITAIVVGAFALVAVVGAFTYRAVYAQSETPTPGTNGGQTLPPGGPGRGGRDGGRMGFDQENLAAALGITTEQLQTAEKTANAEALKEAVAKGLITQEQADQMSQNGFRGPHFGGADGIDYDALLAKALNISTDQLKAARQQAFETSLDNAVKNGTMTQTQADTMRARNALANDSKFQASLKSAYEAAVKQAVSDGVITQAQADALLQEEAQKPWGGPGFGMGGHRGGPGGPGFGPGTQAPNNGTPAPTQSGSNG